MYTRRFFFTVLNRAQNTKCSSVHARASSGFSLSPMQPQSLETRGCIRATASGDPLVARQNILSRFYLDTILLVPIYPAMAVVAVRCPFPHPFQPHPSLYEWRILTTPGPLRLPLRLSSPAVHFSVSVSLQLGSPPVSLSALADLVAPAPALLDRMLRLSDAGGSG